MMPVMVGVFMKTKHLVTDMLDSGRRIENLGLERKTR